MASASNDSQVRVWDMNTMKELYRLKHTDSVICIAFHNDLIISSSHDNSTRIWNKKTGEQLHSLTHLGVCYNFDISPNGAFIALANFVGVSIWSMANFNKVGDFEFLGATVDVRFQTNEKIVATLKNGHVYLITTD